MTLDQAINAASTAEAFQKSANYYLANGDVITALDRFSLSERYRAQVVSYLAVQA